MLHTCPKLQYKGHSVRRELSALNVECERLSIDHRLARHAVIQVWRGYTDCTYDKPNEASFMKAGELG